MNFLQMEYDALNRINETAAAVVGTFRDGAGGITEAGLATVGAHINDGLADIARYHWPTADTATYSWAAGQAITNFASFVCNSSTTAILINCRSVQWNGIKIDYADRAATENWFPSLITDASSSPTNYYADAIEGIGLAPVPSATHIVTVRGQIVPGPLVNAGDSPTWLPSDLHYTAVLYACHQIIIRNADDSTLKAKGMEFADLYKRACDKIRSRVYRTDAQLAADLLEDPPQGVEAPPQ